MTSPASSRLSTARLSTVRDAGPWYREPWPWLLMSGPAAVIVAGVFTTWIAFASADGLVAEDYYKQGLAINKVLAREEAARARGLSAEVELAPGVIRVRLQGGAPESQPEVLFVHLAHATRAGHDLRLRLARGASGVYEGELPAMPKGHWRVSVEDAKGVWRISKNAA